MVTFSWPDFVAWGGVLAGGREGPQLQGWNGLCALMQTREGCGAWRPGKARTPVRLRLQHEGVSWLPIISGGRVSQHFLPWRPPGLGVTAEVSER